MPRKADSKTRKRTGKDLDQIQEDFLPEKHAKLMEQPVDVDLPGDGQFYCVECSRYFLDVATMSRHKTTKVHKRRVKALLEPAHTQKDAEAAAGMGG